MSEGVLTALSVISTVCAIVFGYAAFMRNKTKDGEEDVRRDTAILSEIGYVKSGVDDIKAEQREQRKTNVEVVTRLTAVEASAKQAHKRLDDMQRPAAKD